ncbi:alpha/beta fold hydrolase [Nitrincola iocasae]|uniref:Alpha/beta fold hydrolase n=1 Tax=Nitrincola iocasae TaxID=2614693 RepID=A0A5J6LB55_9GAMM|nr:alpha/beta fold hydrolase [Nitrincola iocasae]QEW05616.1 alpha/beta fold hydrolase [Nitrincola iocasae]
MKLHFQRSGQGNPLVILHGLFGTLENWGAQVKLLTEHFDVIAVDLRNHGRSPHSAEMSYPLMAADVLELLDDLGLDRVDMIGHSMGGKVAMQLAMHQPERLNKLMVVDIAPVSYAHDHDEVFSGLFSVKLDQLHSRSDADTQLKQHIDNPAIRAFLLKNLYRNQDKAFTWRMNLNALKNNYDAIAAAPEGSPFSGQVRFIKGGQSHYLQPEYSQQVKQLFPEADVKVIADAGHWPHAEKPAIFFRLVMGFFLAS